MKVAPTWIWLTIFMFYILTLCQGQLTTNSDQREDGLCDCGYTDDEQQVWTHVWTADFEKEASWDQLNKDFFTAKYEIPAKYEGTFGRMFSAENVKMENGVLRLEVTVDNSTQPAARCGAIGTKRQDILYGSFRSQLKLTNVNGSVQSMYFFHPGGEIDIEIVSAVTPPQAYFAIHPGLQEPNGRASALTHDNHPLGFDPSLDFHEYRFDWYPDRAVFYIDGQWAQTLTTNIPQTPGRFMFSHWTDGNPKFSQGPPDTNAAMEIKSMVALFNTSSSVQCQQTQTACAFSGIANRPPSSASQQSSPITLEAHSISDEIELPKPSDGNKNTESYLVVFLFLVGCTVLLV